MSDTAQPDDGTGSAELRLGFTLRKNKCRRAHAVVCHVRSHEHGWELILDVDGILLRSRVRRSTDEVISKVEAWRAARIDRS